MSIIYLDPDYPIDSLWDFFYRHIGSMMNSHYHDIITYSGALGACILMFFIKKHIKYKWVNILMASCLSFGFYSVCAINSYRLSMNTNWTLVAFVAPMAYLTIIDLLRGDWINRVTVYSGALFIAAYNYIYCIINEDHHKMCYSLKWFIIVFGIAGYVRNIVNSIKKKKEVKRTKKVLTSNGDVEPSGSSDIPEPSMVTGTDVIQQQDNMTKTENSRDPE